MRLKSLEDLDVLKSSGKHLQGTETVVKVAGDIYVDDELRLFRTKIVLKVDDYSKESGFGLLELSVQNESRQVINSAGCVVPIMHSHVERGKMCLSLQENAYAEAKTYRLILHWIREMKNKYPGGRILTTDRISSHVISSDVLSALTVPGVRMDFFGVYYEYSALEKDCIVERNKSFLSAVLFPLFEKTPVRTRFNLSSLDGIRVYQEIPVSIEDTKFYREKSQYEKGNALIRNSDLFSAAVEGLLPKAQRVAEELVAAVYPNVYIDYKRRMALKNKSN